MATSTKRYYVWFIWGYDEPFKYLAENYDSAYEQYVIENNYDVLNGHFLHVEDEFGTIISNDKE
mgnify:CR=1 FL=1